MTRVLYNRVRREHPCLSASASRLVDVRGLSCCTSFCHHEMEIALITFPTNKITKCWSVVCSLARALLGLGLDHSCSHTPHPLAFSYPLYSSLTPWNKITDTITRMCCSHCCSLCLTLRPRWTSFICNQLLRNTVQDSPSVRALNRQHRSACSDGRGWGV